MDDMNFSSDDDDDDGQDQGELLEAAASHTWASA